VLSVTGHARLQDWFRLAQSAKQASVAASANRSLRSFIAGPPVAGPNSDRSKAALIRNFIEKSRCLSLVIVISSFHPTVVARISAMICIECSLARRAGLAALKWPANRAGHLLAG
jgi:hypothetical protein